MNFYRPMNIRKVAIGSLFASAAILLAVAFYQGASKTGIPGWETVNEPLQSALALLSEDEDADLTGDGKAAAEAAAVDPRRLPEPAADTPDATADPGSPDEADAPVGAGDDPGIAPDPALRSGPSDAADPESGESADSDGRLDLNRATQAELETLPGIGPSKAKAILDYRAKIGAFRQTDQLLDVKGIGPKVFERISGSVRVGSPK
ncbi:ComEA family DNA-binding protein [Paenibacillaceae bacterium WGS1546]|uniref:ComEA family DNA-binding protein n=1 Tax=Cohnella sp. WGS1546 TaxID=3366810 RepID=UPI00372D3272